MFAKPSAFVARPRRAQALNKAPMVNNQCFNSMTWDKKRQVDPARVDARRGAALIA
jgi:hypothetical protein